MADVAAKGKSQKNAIDGGIRIEYDNNRTIFVQNGVVIREDTASGTNFYNETGQLIARNGVQSSGAIGNSTFDPDTGVEVYRQGVQDDGKIATSSFDPITGKEIYRQGQLPDDTYGWVVAKEGGDIHDAF